MEPAANHQQEARQIIQGVFGPRGSSPIYATAGRLFDELETEFAAALSSRDREIREVLEGRLAYVESKDLCNGWSGNESGPCCEKCELRDEHLTGRADFLKAAAGCRNPFQLPKVCQCHIPTRQAVKNGQVEILRQVLTALKKS